ncbi:MAG: hypothetical protein A3I38_02350 [Candidatus Wildermuthbacteria bacterium RIFCSPLOWO2_02_FULL_47_10]|nr:MAG: hypothetical protein A3I38_02350 [Candidatus Wildermuthbacteria bacterium RIFCSPLOWO2_02_FULL_47_10]
MVVSSILLLIFFVSQNRHWLTGLTTLTTAEKTEQLRRMNEYPPAAYRLANLIEARKEAVIYFKLERRFLDFFDLPKTFGGGLKPVLLPLLLFGLFEMVKRLMPEAATREAAKNSGGRWSTGLVLMMILLLGVGLYFYKLDRLPNSLSDDEATVGYNAYSILTTGRDEYGKTLPLAFRFFGAYTPPLFVYLAVPMIKWFGLNAVSIRALSGVFTLLGILIVYGFVKRLNLVKSALAAILAAFVFAVSPWVVFYARIGYEVTAGYIVFAAGTYFLWRRLSKGKLSIIGLLLLSLSTYIAHTERFLVPIFLVTVGFTFSGEIFNRKNRRQLFIAAVILLISQIPNLYLMTTKSFWTKSEVFGDWNVSRTIGEFSNQLLTYFSPKALFGTPADINLQHTAPEIGLFYSWLIIPFFIGLYQLYWKRKTVGGKYLLVMLLTAPIPGAFSGHFISVQRVLPLIMPLVLVTALGFDFLLAKIRPIFFLPPFLLLSGLSLVLLWRSYFVLFPKERSAYWSYGYEQMAEILKNNPGKFYVIDSARAGTVYSGLLFYLKFSPAEFQKQFPPELAREYYSNPKISPSYKFANVELRGITWEKDIFVNQILVGDPLAISADQAREHFLVKTFEIKDPNEKPILVGYKTDPGRKAAANLPSKIRNERGE